MQFPSVALLSCILLCTAFTSFFRESIGDQCRSLVNGPFAICTTAGYNYTLPLHEKIDGELKEEIAGFLTTRITILNNCSKYNVAAAMECSLMFPKCAEGKRVYPCRRVCGEFLKQCMSTVDDFRALYMDFFFTLCLSLPNGKPNKDECFEPPNFTTNDSIPSPLDRGCTELIIPACKDLGHYEHTHLSKSAQKFLYMLFYNKTYDENDLEKGFPKFVEDDLAKYPKCRKNIEKLFCGDILSPCFPEEKNHVFKTLCKSVCEQIDRDCPEFFKGDFYDLEFCGMLPEGETSHGYCDQKEWPPPFHWLDFMDRSTPRAPTKKPKEPEKQGPRGWVIAVALVVTLVIVGLALGGLIWWKWRGHSTSMGYTKQEDEPAPQQ